MPSGSAREWKDYPVRTARRQSNSGWNCKPAGFSDQGPRAGGPTIAERVEADNVLLVPAWRMLPRAAGFIPAVRTAGINPAARQNVRRAAASKTSRLLLLGHQRAEKPFQNLVAASRLV